MENMIGQMINETMHLLGLNQYITLHFSFLEAPDKIADNLSKKV